MATPLMNTVPVVNTTADAYFLVVGSGSMLSRPMNSYFGNPTGAPADTILYRLTDLLQGDETSTAPTVVLREKPANPVGQWLESTQDMLPEIEVTPLGAYARALDELKSNLGVTLTYVAKCLGLQRSAIYKWYEGRQPHASNRSRLKTINEFAAAWKAARLPSLRNYWDISIPGSRSTLGELLSAQTLDIVALRTAIDSITGNAAALPKAPRLGFPDRKPNPQKDREKLSALISQTSREDDEN